ncbi:MAG TPA: dockerin type I domain-containing protein, partial [Clostridia bacterium]
MKKKYFLLSILVLALAMSMICFTFASAAPVFGDLNNDGKVNSTDSSLLKRHLLGTSTLSNPLLADVNGDGAVNSTDYSLYKRYLLNVITVFPGQTITVTPTPTITPTPAPIRIPTSGSEIDTSSIKTKYINLAYGSVSKTQTLDIYLPNEGSGPFPVIIAIHGGAFLGGSSKGTDIAPMLEGGINHGYAVVSLNYRLSSEAKFPAGVNDVKAAVRFVRANASKYKLNTDKISAWGFSSGGFLVSMLGTTGNVSTLNGDTQDNLNYSSDVKAVVDWSGHIDFLTMDDQFRASGIQSAFGNTNDASSPASQLIGQLI